VWTEASSRILIVDNDKEFRCSLQKTLRKAGYRVATASGGRGARKKLNANIFPIILLDLSTPDFSGLKILREILRKSPETKVLVLTADDDPGMTQKALQAGAFGLLKKPVKREALLYNIKLALDQLIEWQE